MNPVEFGEQNCVIAKSQKPYLPLPSHKAENGEVWSCWGLSFLERIKILFTWKLWIGVLTFNNPLQPLKPTLAKPFIKNN